MYSPTITAETFDRIPGDTSTYALGDCERVVRMAREVGTVAVDIETKGLGRKRFQLTSIAIGTADEAHVLDPDDPNQVLAAADAVAAAQTLIFHNATFDVPPLVRAGVMRAEDVSKVLDTLVLSRLAWPDGMVRKGLGEVAARLLGEEYRELKDSLKTGWKASTGRPVGEMWEVVDLSQPAFRAYAGWDVIATSRVHPALVEAVRTTLTDHPFDPVDVNAVAERELRVNRVMLGTSVRGIGLDFGVVDDVVAEMQQAISDCDEDLLRHGIEERSDPLIKRAVVDRLAAEDLLPVSWPRLKNGSPSARKDWLGRVDHPLVDIATRRSEAGHFLRDYAEKFVDVALDGRIHPEVKVLGATTGRMSYGSPPLQQYPTSVRRMMRHSVPITSLDWSAIEPVLTIYLAGETDVIASYEAGDDIYGFVSEAAGVPRKTAKTVFLAQLYGQGAPGLAIRLEVTEDKARQVISEVMGRIPHTRKLIDKVRMVAGQYGSIQTLGGRVIPIDKDFDRPGRFKGYKGVNYLIQGSAYDLLADVLVKMDQEGLDRHLVAAVHDELVVETEIADEVRRLMQTPPAWLTRTAGRVPVLRTDRDDMGEHWVVSE
jgi:DNA polymerase-1